MRAEYRRAGMAAAMPSASQPVDPRPVSGLASGSGFQMEPIPAAAPSRANAQWRMRWLDSLTVAGAAPDWSSYAGRRRHRLPVSTRGRTPPGHLEAREV